MVPRMGVIGHFFGIIPGIDHSPCTIMQGGIMSNHENFFEIIPNKITHEPVEMNSIIYISMS